MALYSQAGIEAAGIPVMTNQDKIKYLKRYSLMNKEINRMTNEAVYWRGQMEKVTAVYSGQPQGGGSIYGKTESIVAKIVDLEREINAGIDRLIDIRAEIEAVITAVQDDRERLLLQYRYIDGHTFEWIAGEMELSWQWVHELHSRALSKIILSS